MCIRDSMEWIDEGRGGAVRLKACDPHTRRWLSPHQMVRHLGNHHPQYLVERSSGMKPVELSAALQHHLSTLVNEVL